jgi:hypothetical protein
MKWRAALLWLLLAPPAVALDAGDSRGLSVTIERISGPLVVDGLALHVERAHGRDVATLAQRIQQRWRIEGSHPQLAQHQDWQMASRWSGNRNEVLQWRDAGSGGELLFSWLDATRPPGRPAAAPLTLPPPCSWGRAMEGEIQGGRYWQHTARCRGTPRELLPRLRDALDRQRWSISDAGGGIWDVTKQDAAARVIVVAGPVPGETAVIWIGQRRDAP